MRKNIIIILLMLIVLSSCTKNENNAGAGQNVVQPVINNTESNQSQSSQITNNNDNSATSFNENEIYEMSEDYLKYETYSSDPITRFYEEELLELFNEKYKSLQGVTVTGIYKDMLDTNIDGKIIKIPETINGENVVCIYDKEEDFKNITVMVPSTVKITCGPNILNPQNIEVISENPYDDYTNSAGLTVPVLTEIYGYPNNLWCASDVLLNYDYDKLPESLQYTGKGHSIYIGGNYIGNGELTINSINNVYIKTYSENTHDIKTWGGSFFPIKDFTYPKHVVINGNDKKVSHAYLALDEDSVITVNNIGENESCNIQAGKIIINNAHLRYGNIVLHVQKSLEFNGEMEESVDGGYITLIIPNKDIEIINTTGKILPIGKIYIGNSEVLFSTGNTPDFVVTEDRISFDDFYIKINH